MHVAGGRLDPVLVCMAKRAETTKRREGTDLDPTFGPSHPPVSTRTECYDL